MKKDISHNKACYEHWKEKAKAFGEKGLSKANSDMLVNYIFDMEVGSNVGRGSKKGGRSYGNLNVTRRKLIQIIKMLEERGIKDIRNIKEKELVTYIDDITKGRILREDGKKYGSPREFVRTFKKFWHWYMNVERKKGNTIPDICEDLSLEGNGVTFVYFTKEQMEKMMPYFTKEEQLLVLFLFDAIPRFPTEVASLTAKDVYMQNGEVWINIPDDVAKVIGRHFNLLYSGEALMKYIKENGLEPDDYLFEVIKDNNRVYAFNKKLKQVAVQVFGDVISHPKAQKKFSEISGYDFRHSGAIHFRILSQKTGISLDAVRQRGGWKTFDMLNYYSQFIGLTGEIKKESILVEEDKSKMQKKIEELEKQIKEMKPVYNKTQKEKEEMIKFFQKQMEEAIKKYEKKMKTLQEKK